MTATQVKSDDTQEIKLAYVPRKHQYQLHRDLRRFSVVICHRRFGKSVFAVNWLIDEAVRSNKVMPRFAYIAPTFGQAKRIIWDYLKQFTKNLPGVSYNEAELRCDFAHNQARIMVLSAENYDSIKGIYLDIGVLDEFGSMSPAAWREAVRPTLSDRKGMALFIGTVKGTNHFWDMYEHARDANDPEWYAAMFKASETKIISDEELRSARASMSEEEYMQEFECDPLAGLVGAYFAKEISLAYRENRIKQVPHDPSMAVDTYWDLGMNDTTAIWFVQSTRTDHRIIDYYEVSGDSISTVLSKLQEWALEKKYVYGEFVLPHDAKVRDLSTGKSRVQNFYSNGCRKVRVVPRIGDKMEGINAARTVLKKCFFDSVRCKFGIKALSNYQKKYNEKTNVFSDSPLHNWASNAADAFQQLGLGSRGESGDSGINEEYDYRSKEIESETTYNPYG